jgi:SAM-dependent methyltransferase
MVFEAHAPRVTWWAVKRHAIATDKNRDVILAALRQLLPPAGKVLEIASGTGQHAVYFAHALPSIVWQPSDRDPDALDSIEAWRREAALPNLRRPLEIDTTHEEWGVAEPVDAIVNINMAHDAPWAAFVGLLNGAPRCLRPGGRLIVYGPWIISGRPTASSNQEFDAGLRRQDPRLGLRDLDQATAIAESRGLTRDTLTDCPSNNVIIGFRK